MSNRGRAVAAMLVATWVAGTGCNGGGWGGDRIREMELQLDGGVATFVIPEQDWLAPFSRPTVTELVVASEEDEIVWRIAAESESGVPARGLAVTFGTMAAGFMQVVPDETSRPKPLVPGRNYYVAAGGATNVYRLIFALPISMTRPATEPTTKPVDEAFPRKDMWEKMRQAPQAPEAEQPPTAPDMQGDQAEPPGKQPEPPPPPPTEGTPPEEPEGPPKLPSIFGD